MQKSIFPDKYRILSGSALKMIAMISMLIDHTAFILAPVIPFLKEDLFAIGGTTITLYWIMRKIGRLAFPIFCFLITEGYTHTRNKFKYGLNLLIFAVLSELPYNVMYGNLFDLTRQNIFFTLFIGLLLIYIVDNVKSHLYQFILLGLIVISTHYFRPSYGINGTLLILVMYLLKNHPAAQAIVSYPLLANGLPAFTAFFPINLYNGQRGFIKSPFVKYIFYLFYPAHIGILVVIGYIVSHFF